MASRDSFTRSKPLQHFVSAFDDVSGHVAFMRHAHVCHGVAADKAIACKRTGTSRPASDSCSLPSWEFSSTISFASAAVDLAGVAQAAACVWCRSRRSSWRTRVCADHERFKSFLAQLPPARRQSGCRLYRSERLSCGASAKMDGATRRIWSSDSGNRSDRSVGGMGSETGCELHDLSPMSCCCWFQSPDRIPRFGARLSDFRLVRRRDLGRSLVCRRFS